MASRIKEILSEDLVMLTHEPFRDKAEVFAYMAGILESKGYVEDADKYVAALNYRESLGSTYMGKYLALPHGKCKEVLKTSVAFCRCTEPFLYRSFDEEGEVKYIFALAIAGTQEGAGYLQILAELAGYLANEEFMELLEKAASYEDIVKALEMMEDEEV